MVLWSFPSLTLLRNMWLFTHVLTSKIFSSNTWVLFLCRADSSFPTNILFVRYFCWLVLQFGSYYCWLFSPETESTQVTRKIHLLLVYGHLFIFNIPLIKQTYLCLLCKIISIENWDGMIRENHPWNNSNLQN